MYIYIYQYIYILYIMCKFWKWKNSEKLRELHPTLCTFQVSPPWTIKNALKKDPENTRGFLYPLVMTFTLCELETMAHSNSEFSHQERTMVISHIYADVYKRVDPWRLLDTSLGPGYFTCLVEHLWCATSVPDSVIAAHGSAVPGWWRGAWRGPDTILHDSYDWISGTKCGLNTYV